MHTLLHISDLHRSPQEPVSNESLLASLLADRDRFVTETPQVPPPDSIIVSGDIIQGAPLGAVDWAKDVAAQYGVAYDFLSSLADRLVSGDRSRVVVVPGNHDVCWNSSRSAMRAVARRDEPRGIPHVFTPDTKFRWSWSERKVFEVADLDGYRRRLDAFWAFVERFYAGARLAYPLARGRGFNLFELADGLVVVAAFESLHGNDCFCLQGAMEGGVVARCGLAIRDSAKKYALQLAVWHHSIQGPPEAADYMDVRTVHEMIGNGFRLGLHGHQHASAASAHYIHLPEQHAMAVISAGSLCAGSRELPRGVDRQYNLISIADDYLSAAVHVREMNEGLQFGRCTRGTFGVPGPLTVKWERPADALGRPVDVVATRARAAILEAERALSSGAPQDALQHLKQVRTPPGSYARALTFRAAQTLKQWELIRAIAQPPADADELVALVEALSESDELTLALDALAQHAGPLGLATHIQNSLRERLEARVLLRGGER